jgi:serine/threonine-protein kinase HipA
LIDSSASLDLAIDVAEYFDLDSQQAKKIIKEVGFATALWRKTAEKFKIKKTEIERMASAFEHEDLQKTMK